MSSPNQSYGNFLSAVSGRWCLLRKAGPLNGLHGRLFASNFAIHMYVWINGILELFVIPYSCIRKITIQANPFPYLEQPPTVTLDLYDQSPTKP